VGEVNSEELTDVQIVKLATLLHRGVLQLSAESYNESGWRELVDMGLLKSSFTSWARLQYSVMVDEECERVVTSCLARAASVAGDYDLYDVVRFLTEYMPASQLPELLSHEFEVVRDVAAARLKELADSPTAKK